MSLATARDEDARPAADHISSEAQALRRILFVDRHPRTAQALSEALAQSGPQWRVDAVGTGEQALAALATKPADVVVADETLEEMDGITLLTRVREKHPTTIRMILSEGATSQRPSVAAIVAHRMLAKPCNVGEVEVAVRRSCALHRLNHQAEAHRRTVRAAALPSRPGVYMELNRVLSDPGWQPNQIAAVVERDVVMTAKVLQLANSALFGLTQTVTSVQGAVMFLGVDTIKSLALTAEAFGKLAPRNVDGFSIEAFQAHAMLVARLTAAILPAGRAQQEAVTAALLHDIGKLVLISDSGQRWTQLHHQAIERGIPLHEVELATEGVTHADIGSYLLSLWGLPDAIAEAVALHHSVGSVEGLALDGVAAVHIADALAHELGPAGEDQAPPAPLDMTLVERLGLESRVQEWRATARRLEDAASPAPTSEGR